MDEAKIESQRLLTSLRRVTLAGTPELDEAWSVLKDNLIENNLEVSGATNIETARLGFELLSFSILRLLNQFGNPLDISLHLAHCPMAAGSDGASWVQRGDDIRNSYFGASMYRCGNLVEKIDSGGYLPIPEQGVGR